MVQSNYEITADLLGLAVGVAVFYFALNPDALDNLRDRFCTGLEKVLHRVSVWNARQAIRSLPEIK